MRASWPRLPDALSLAAWAAAWEGAGRAVDLVLLPPLSTVLLSAWELAREQRFLDAVAVSLEAFAIGMSASIIAGVALGTCLGRIPMLDRLVGPWVNVGVSMPLTALVPAMMVVLGLGQTTVITTVFLFSIWVIVLDTRAGMRDVDPALPEMARSFGARRAQIVVGILLPAALPEILAGIRLGVINGVRGVVVGQVLIAVFGLGELLEVYSRYYLMERFWALILYLCAFSYAAATLVQAIERRVERYARHR